jgi:two-component system, NarL family, response regulator NreC
MARKDQVLVVGNRLTIDSTVRNLLSMHPDWEVRGVVEYGKEVIEKILELMPHVVVLDMSGPVVLDSDSISEIRRIAPDIKVRVVRLANS